MHSQQLLYREHRLAGKKNHKTEMAHKYILRVTAGPANDPKLHKVVPVNSPVPLSIESDLIDIDLNVRIQVCIGPYP